MVIDDDNNNTNTNQNTNVNNTTNATSNNNNINSNVNANSSGVKSDNYESPLIPLKKKNSNTQVMTMQPNTIVNNNEVCQELTDPNNSVISYSSSMKKGKEIKESEEIIRLRREFDKFFTNQTAYINLKENNKLLVFNTELSINDVVEAMTHEDIYCGLIWNTEHNKFTGLFTIRDCLIALYFSYEKITKLALKGSQWSNAKQLASLIFQKNDFQVEELDVIMENGNSYSPSEDEENENVIKEKEKINCNDYHSNSNVSNLSKKQSFNQFNTNDNQNLGNIELLYGESKFSSYKEYFEVFNYVTLNEYLTDLHNDILLTRNIISVDLDCQLKEAIRLMQKHMIHRIVVEDTKNNCFVGLVTYESIFTYFVNNYYNYDMECFNVNYKILNLLTSSLICCYEDQTIYSCFFKIWESRISMMPILERPENKQTKEVKVLGYLFLKDLVYFMTNGENFKFTDPIKTFLKELYSDVNEERPLGKDRIVFINESDNYTFKEIMEFINFSPEKKIVIHKTNNPNTLLGIISLSDIFKLIFP